MVRLANITRFVINKIKWGYNTSIIYFTRSKGVKEGKNEKNLRYIYSNIFEPRVYTVLKLSKYLLYNPYLVNNGRIIFPGVSQYNSFMQKSVQ